MSVAVQHIIMASLSLGSGCFLKDVCEQKGISVEVELSKGGLQHKLCCSAASAYLSFA